ncbi:MAG: hypothetical protein AB7K67_01035 [Hyphomicrobiaceae bacterium]
MSGEIFTTRTGVAWRREWVTRPAAGSPQGESTGATQDFHYEWTTADGRLVAWCESRRFEDDPVKGGRREVHVYRATLDGRTSEKSWPTLLEAMAAGERARWLKDYRERERTKAPAAGFARAESRAPRASQSEAARGQAA